jgi:hypothetical protein
VRELTFLGVLDTAVDMTFLLLSAEDPAFLEMGITDIQSSGRMSALEKLLCPGQCLDMAHSCRSSQLAMRVLMRSGIKCNMTLLRSGPAQEASFKLHNLQRLETGIA